MAGKAKILYFQEPLFEEMKKDICYVCHKWIKKGAGLNVGKGVWRHEKCKPYRLEIGEKDVSRN